MKKISHKITLAIILSVIFVALMVGGISVFISVTMIKEAARNNLKLEAQVITQQVDAKLNSIQAILEDMNNVIINSIDISKLKSDVTYMDSYFDELEATMTSFANAGKINTDMYLFFHQELYQSEEMNSLLIINPDGKGFVRESLPIMKKDLNEDKEGFAWYHGPINQGKIFWSDPYEDPILKERLVTCSVPVILDGVTIGLIAMDVKFDDFTKIVNDTKLYRTGFAALADKDYQVLVHPKYSQKDNLRSINNGELTDMTKYIDIHSSGTFEGKVDGVNTIVGFSKLTNGNTLIVFVPTSELFEKLNSMLLYIIIAVVIGIIISSIIAIFLGIRLSKPIIKLAQLFKLAEQGDLTVQSSVKSVDETKQLSDAFNLMISNTNKLIGATKAASNTVMDTASEINGIADYVKNSSQEITNALSELAKGTSEQASVTEDGNRRISNIMKSIEVIVADIKNIENLMAEANRDLETGKNAVNQQQTYMGEIRLVTQKVSNSVINLTDKSNEIEKVIGFIRSISEQTNLLALNASIEAARAGEHGRGFSVVAEQIGKMAEETSNSIRKIEAIIKDMQNGVHTAVSEMKAEQEASERLDLIVADTFHSFKGIADAIDIITTKIEVLTEEAVKLNENSTEAENVISYVASFSEETAASTQEIDASTQEQINSVYKLAKAIAELQKTAQELNNHIEIFKV